MPIQVNIKENIGNRTRQAKLVENAPMSKLIPHIVTALGYPVTDPQGRQVTYQISYNGRQLKDDETLASAGIHNGDSIDIIPEFTVGPTPWTFKEKNDHKTSVKVEDHTRAAFPHIAGAAHQTQIQVNINGLNGRLTWQARLAKNVPVSELITHIINMFGYVDIDSLGRQVTYCISFNGRKLEDEETLASANVRDGDFIGILREYHPSYGSLQLLKVFLCYSSGDKAVVRDLYQRLKTVSVNPWLDEEEILPGQEWAQEIAKTVRASKVVIVCLSKNSITKEGFVQKEIKIALDVAAEKPEGAIFIIPAKLEECVVPERLSHWHWVNLYEGNGFEKLVRSIKTIASTI